VVLENIARLKGRIASACLKANRDPSQITIVAAIKGRSLQAVKEAIRSGICDIGGNRVQESVLIYNELTSQPDDQLTKQRVNETASKRIKWHMIGHLQTNKAKEAVKIFGLIHSVDSLRLAQEIDKRAREINKVQDILIEVKTSPEETKSGVAPERTLELAGRILSLKNVSLKGLMTIAPLVDNPEKTRPCFRQLRELLVKLGSMPGSSGSIRILSMGMSDDLEVAIEEGSNMIRVGRAVFES